VAGLFDFRTGRLNELEMATRGGVRGGGEAFDRSKMPVELAGEGPDICPSLGIRGYRFQRRPNVWYKIDSGEA
jgi:hypothetical protein